MRHSLTTATISLPALRNNLAVARRAAPASNIMAVIKADAYGHGLCPVADALMAHSDALAVARIEEAITLREHGIDLPLVILSGIHNTEALAACRQFRLQPVIHRLSMLKALARLPAAVPYWLKVDTGMHRLGLAMDELAQLATLPPGCIGIMSHMADAELPDHPGNRQQAQQFLQMCSRWPQLAKSLANSATLLLHPALQHQWVRPGIMLYGANPGSINTPATDQLQAAMRLQSTVIATRPVTAGERVGYNGLWQASRDSRIATVAIGYADGYPRHAPAGTPVWINGRQYPLAGRVSMDLITVDVTDGAVREGDSVELWGEHIAATTVAGMAGTISYALFTGVTQRVPRIYQDN